MIISPSTDRAIVTTIWCGALVYLGHRFHDEHGWDAVVTVASVIGIIVVLIGMMSEPLPKTVQKAYAAHER